MAHKTLIDGTSYEIVKGKTLVDGTAYEIVKGKTLVDGTVRQIEFVEMYTVYIHKRLLANNFTMAGVRINGQVYTGEHSMEIVVPEGTIIECFVICNEQAYDDVYNAFIYMNGVNIERTNEPNKIINYTHIVDSTIYIRIGAANLLSATGPCSGGAYIADDGKFAFAWFLQDAIAVSGMTWQEWCASEYNNANPCTCIGDTVQFDMVGNKMVITMADGTIVKPTDAIIPLYDYTGVRLEQIS